MHVKSSCEGKMHDAKLDIEVLARCPFCGGSTVNLKHTWTAAYWIECVLCRAQKPGECDEDADHYDADTHMKNEISAVIAWNTRIRVVLASTATHGYVGSS